MKCPGQEKRYWTADDVYEVSCPSCNAEVEFFKTDLTRRCPNCGRKFRNPHLNLECAEWCAYGRYCLGALASAAQTARLPETPDGCPQVLQ